MAARVITITSGKGGVGKTTATANLGVALASLGKKVVCLDADIGLRNLDVVMGLENRIVYDIVDVIEGRAKLRQAMIKDKRLKTELYLIPAAQTRDKTAVSPSDMVRVCEELRPLVDFILVDSPAGIERGFRNAIAPADDVLIVTNPEVSSVRDADRIIGLIEAEGKGPGRLVVNRVKPEMVKRGDMLSPEDIIDILAIQLIGLIPEDASILVSTNRGLPVTMKPDESLAGTAFMNIGRRLMGEEVEFLALEEEEGFFKKVFGKRKTRGKTQKKAKEPKQEKKTAVSTSPEPDTLAKLAAAERRAAAQRAAEPTPPRPPVVTPSVLKPQPLSTPPTQKPVSPLTAAPTPPAPATPTPTPASATISSAAASPATAPAVVEPKAKPVASEEEKKPEPPSDDKKSIPAAKQPIELKKPLPKPKAKEDGGAKSQGSS